MLIFQLECCGVNNYTEYGAHLADLPLSCFKVYDTLSVHTKSWTLLFTVGLDSSTRDLTGFKLFAFICCNYCKYCCLCSKWYEYLKIWFILDAMPSAASALVRCQPTSLGDNTGSHLPHTSKRYHMIDIFTENVCVTNNQVIYLVFTDHYGPGFIFLVVHEYGAKRGSNGGYRRENQSPPGSGST